MVEIDFDSSPKNDNDSDKEKNGMTNSETDNKSDDKIAELNNELDEYKNKYLRLLAEFDNYKKRTKKEFREVGDIVRFDMIKEFLSILDNLEKAHNAATEHYKAITDGIELTIKSFKEILNKHGILEISDEGVEFNPDHHEALMMQDSDNPKNTIIKVLQKGYKTDKRLVRPAKVIVSSGANKVDKEKIDGD